MSTLRLAFIGFRHGHAMQIYNASVKYPGLKVVAACEEDAPTAATLRQEGKVALTHADYQTMLDSVDCDAVAVGDCYARRGQCVIAALERGKHVIADKPICIQRDELKRITQLARERRLSVGCLLDLRGSGSVRTVRRLIGEGAIGEVHTVAVAAQHPLIYGARPAWYFQPGMHGGTINDIGIHAFDAIPWVTGRRIAGIVAARAWNARLPQHPQFQDAAQFMLRLDNGGGVLGDVSYLAPDGCGYVAPQYWRMTFHGSDGMIECDLDRSPVSLATRIDKAVRLIPPDPPVAHAAIESFLREVTGQDGELTLGTEQVLEASRIALAVQEAADGDLRDVEL